MNSEANMIRIESGIPVPHTNRGAHKSPVRLALESMDVSQSFVADLPYWKLNASIQAVRKETGRTFVTRSIGDNQYRVWRLT